MLSFQVLSAAAVLSDLYNTNSKPAANPQWFVQLLQQLHSFEKYGSSENKIIYFLFFKRYEKNVFFFLIMKILGLCSFSPYSELVKIVVSVGNK